MNDPSMLEDGPVTQAVTGMSEHGTMARFRLLRPGRPAITQVLPFMAKVHQALCALSDLGQGSSFQFSGRDRMGNPLQMHEHAYLFGETTGLDGTITHLSVWVGGGFVPEALAALARLERIWGHGGPDVRLRLEGIGSAAAQGTEAMFGAACEWTSHTPFISSRFTKTFRDGRPKIDPDNGWPIGSGPHELLRLLAIDPRFANATVRLAQGGQPMRYGKSSFAPTDFEVRRKEGYGNRGESIGNALTIRFPEPVTGPIALGYGAHFGLGQFRAVKSKNDRRPTIQ